MSLNCLIITVKCTEQNMELYAVFIDFTKAFNTVSREGLWSVLKRFGCTDKIINLVRAFHDGMKAKIVQGKETSKEFEVTNGVKQGCVLAPTLFSIYLAAMLHVAFKDVHEGIYIQTRHGADLFNVSHFEAKSRTTKHLVRELLFADDSALVAHTASDMQLLVDRFSMAASQFSLKINIKKTECMYQPVKFICPPPELIDITIDEVPLVKTTDFTYLGSTVSSSSKIDRELRTRTGKASAAFGKLQQRLWNNKHVSIRVKCKVILGMGDFNGHVGKRIKGYKGVHGGNGIGERNVEGKMLLEFCDERSCVWQTHGSEKGKRGK